MDAVCDALAAFSDHNDVDDIANDYGHEQTLAKILNRKRHLSERICFSRPLTPLENHNMDTRWISSESLTHPWVAEDKWWLSNPSYTILDTNPRVFGRKKVFLIDKKYPRSENNLSISYDPST